MAGGWGPILDEDDFDDEDHDNEWLIGPEFGEDTDQREVALIALGAAALARRTFPPGRVSVDALRRESSLLSRWPDRTVTPRRERMA